MSIDQSAYDWVHTSWFVVWEETTGHARVSSLEQDLTRLNKKIGEGLLEVN